MTRTESRILAFELLYSLEIQKINKDELEEQISLFLEDKEINEKKALDYVKNTVNGIYDEKEDILKLIESNLKAKWDINRISKINLSLLELGIFEIIYIKIPYKVVVNEVVEIAKKYGDDNSQSFINGVLANVIKEKNIQ